mgnify:CR=1 FL=1
MLEQGEKERLRSDKREYDALMQLAAEFDYEAYEHPLPDGPDYSSDDEDFGYMTHLRVGSEDYLDWLENVHEQLGLPLGVWDATRDRWNFADMQGVAWTFTVRPDHQDVTEEGPLYLVSSHYAQIVMDFAVRQDRRSKRTWMLEARYFGGAVRELVERFAQLVEWSVLKHSARLGVSAPGVALWRMGMEMDAMGAPTLMMCNPQLTARYATALQAFAHGSSGETPTGPDEASPKPGAPRLEGRSDWAEKLAKVRAWEERIARGVPHQTAADLVGVPLSTMRSWKKRRDALKD